MAGPKGFVLNEAAARWLKQQVTTQDGSSPLPEVRQFEDGPLRRFYLKNDSGETVPPFGIVRVYSYTSSNNGRIVANITKPNNTIGSNTFLVNGPGQIEVGGVGLAQDSVLQVVACDSGFTISATANYGINGWKLAQAPTGKPLANVKVYADYDTTRNLCIASIQPLERILVKSTTGIPGRVGFIEQGATCTVLSNNTSSGELYDSGVSVNIWNWSKSTVLQNGDGYGVAIWIDNRFKIVAEDCNDSGSTLQPFSTSSSFTEVTDAVDLNNDEVLSSSQFTDAGFTLGLVIVP